MTMRHGSQIDPPNRFETIRRELDLKHLEWDDEYLNTIENRGVEYIPDRSQSIVSENLSPDLPFRFSLNPYRGCAHACSYCYARPTHEYLGFNAGLDFETKIIFKPDASKLLIDFLRRPSWVPEPITFSGVTDCYQPAEREFRLTRQCLEVARDYFQPISIVTKNALIIRDLDILTALASNQLVHVFVSLTTLRPDLARDLEPRTSIPRARLRAVKTLADAGVPVGVMCSPIIPALNETEMPQLLQAASESGALTATYTLLRLPLTVEPVFREWLERTQPASSARVLQRVKQTRAGKLNDSSWGQRMIGQGEIAGQIRQMFNLLRKKNGLNNEMPTLDCCRFEIPAPRIGQRLLF